MNGEEDLLNLSRVGVILGGEFERLTHRFERLMVWKGWRMGGNVK